jgi:hypothetical protein
MMTVSAARGSGEVWGWLAAVSGRGAGRKYNRHWLVERNGYRTKASCMSA